MAFTSLCLGEECWYIIILNLKNVPSKLDLKPLTEMVWPSFTQNIIYIKINNNITFMTIIKTNYK